MFGMSLSDGSCACLPTIYSAIPLSGKHLPKVLLGDVSDSKVDQTVEKTTHYQHASFTSEIFFGGKSTESKRASLTGLTS